MFGFWAQVSYTDVVSLVHMSKVIKICRGKSCLRAAPPLEQAAEERIRQLHAEDVVKVEACGCLGKCKQGPNIIVENDGRSVTHRGVSPRTIVQRVDELAGKKPVIEPGNAQRSVNDLLKGGF